jgi:PAS domain S-box-containing protein
MPAHTAVLDDGGEIIAVNEAWRRFARENGSGTDFVGVNYLEICAAEPEQSAFVGLRSILAGEQDIFELEYPCHGPSQERWFLMRATRHVAGGRLTVLVAHENVSERHDASEQALMRAALLDEVDAAVIVSDFDSTIISWNAGATQLYGWTADEAIGRKVDELLGLVASPDWIPPGPEQDEWQNEFDATRKDGSTFPVYLRRRTIKDESGRPTVAVGLSIDISERHAHEHELRLAQERLRAVTESVGEGLFTLDSDGRVTYLNPAAEQLLDWSLQEIEGRVMHEITHNRRADGTRHAVEDCPILRARRDGEVVRVDDDIFLRRDGSEIPVSYTAAPFVTQAGVQGCVVVFQNISERKAKAKLIAHDLQKLEWVKRIREALKEDLFELYAQPIVALTDRRVVQNELLIRMRSPGRSDPISPGLFLPVAEEFGFINEIDRWVVDRAAEIAAGGLAVELNISGESLGDPGLIGHIRRALLRTGAEPGTMIFEITETALIDDEAAARAFVEQVHQLGCKLALDDFGTGYGGFTYLKRLPVDVLKIDIEFVRDLQSSEASRNVVKAIVGLARGFDLKTVAEGVEDAATLELLIDLGVDYAQGYHIGRPAPVKPEPMLLTPGVAA